MMKNRWLGIQGLDVDYDSSSTGFTILVTTSFNNGRVIKYSCPFCMKEHTHGSTQSKVEHRFTHCTTRRPHAVETFTRDVYD